jgi:hypothetical protein
VKRIPSERGSPSLVGRGIANPQEYPAQSFESYLKSQNKRNAKQILCYAQRYRTILETGDATPLVGLSSGAIRRHVMESLTLYRNIWVVTIDGRKYVNATNFVGHLEMSPLKAWNDSSILTLRSAVSMTRLAK